MKEPFKQYLIKQGYSQWTPNGNPSTVYDYLKRIERVCEWEGLTWSSISNHISRLVQEYGATGTKAKKGAISHNAVLSALCRFKEFVACYN